MWTKESTGWFSLFLALAYNKGKSGIAVTFDNRKHPVINFYTKDIYHTHTILKNNEVEVSDINEYGPLKGMDFYDLNGHLLGICSF